ncbi:hypothetical protein [Actinacidiphila paucisporea]|uniref:Uncharacterized protein n=1 Tax=Actinacidiphila paucisporea TaxID=310782 RepID=A0A1M6Z4D0_9ACTN|nr:hypothetical protein [Actinacidiphila paucisporea]SHL25378.1 hypothetical protein SAMN05216499_103219 [Actinacidiphila paucisporea]
MISEPELTGGPDDGGAEVISDADRPPRWGGARVRRPWVWGIGGVLVASAVWAGGLRAWAVQHDGRPDLHGYVLGDSPCAGSTLSPLTSALHATDTASVSPAAARLGPAIDQIRCTLSAAVPGGGGGTDRFEVFVTIDLHKRTDPRAEFEDQAQVDGSDLTPVKSVRAVTGLGDEAVAQTLSRQSEELKVLHGGAVFTLTLTGYSTDYVSDDTLGALHGGPDHVASDVGRFEPALVDAMRNVMKGQQKNRR